MTEFKEGDRVRYQVKASRADERDIDAKGMVLAVGHVKGNGTPIYDVKFDVGALDAAGMPLVKRYALPQYVTPLKCPIVAFAVYDDTVLVVREDADGDLHEKEHAVSAVRRDKIVLLKAASDFRSGR